MTYYINCLKQSGALALDDVKMLIPDMNMRRRMSRVVKMGVTTGLEALREFDAYGEVDAIITSTGLGCIADSEKFLLNLLSSNEQRLNPTPFIQSTFNTVGAQIALIRSMACHNNTFTHRYNSFDSALLEATLLLDSGMAKAVLVGVFDEATPTVEIVLKRLNVLNEKPLGEGAFFMILTAAPLASSIGALELSLEDMRGANVVRVSEESETLWCGAGAEIIAKILHAGKEGIVINDLGGEVHSSIKINSL